MRRHNAHLYNNLLKDIEGLRLPVEKEWAKNVYWMYSTQITDGFGMGRDELMERLKRKGVDTRTFFIPMHNQPVFRDRGLFEGESYPVAEGLYQRGLLLPSGSGLTRDQIEYVCTIIKEIRGTVRSG